MIKKDIIENYEENINNLIEVNKNFELKTLILNTISYDNRIFILANFQSSKETIITYACKKRRKYEYK